MQISRSQKCEENIEPDQWNENEKAFNLRKRGLIIKREGHDRLAIYVFLAGELQIIMKMMIDELDWV